MPKHRKRRGVSNHPSFLFGKRKERQMEEAIVRTFAAGVGIGLGAVTVVWIFIVIKWIITGG